MTVFKSFFKIVKKNIGTIILYTVLLVVFGAFQYSSNSNQIGFVVDKPDVVIIDDDKSMLSLNLIKYFKDNANVIEMDNSLVDDSLFYRQVSYVIFIHKGYEDEVLNNTFKNLAIKSNGDYNSSYSEMMLNRYLNVQKNYIDLDKENLINKVNEVLSKDINVSLKTKTDKNGLARINSYYNFASYSIMACIVLVITLVLSSYNEPNVKKRITVSSINIDKYNNSLFISGLCYCIIVWFFYNLLAFCLLGNLMFSIRGILYVISSFIYTMLSLIIAIIISNLINNKNAISGIVNVLTVGSSFLCGAFVPLKWLGDNVKNIAHVLPTYYYINANTILSDIEHINMSNINLILGNWLVMILFIILFFVINMIIIRYKRKVR